MEENIDNKAFIKLYSSGIFTQHEPNIELAFFEATTTIGLHDASCIAAALKRCIDKLVERDPAIYTEDTIQFTNLHPDWRIEYKEICSQANGSSKTVCCYTSKSLNIMRNICKMLSRSEMLDVFLQHTSDIPACLDNLSRLAEDVAFRKDSLKKYCDAKSIARSAHAEEEAEKNNIKLDNIDLRSRQNGINTILWLGYNETINILKDIKSLILQHAKLSNDNATTD